MLLHQRAIVLMGSDNSAPGDGPLPHGHAGSDGKGFSCILIVFAYSLNDDSTVGLHSGVIRGDEYGWLPRQSYVSSGLI